jgi:hypothetical protein
MFQKISPFLNPWTAALGPSAQWTSPSQPPASHWPRLSCHLFLNFFISQLFAAVNLLLHVRERLRMCIVQLTVRNAVEER